MHKLSLLYASRQQDTDAIRFHNNIDGAPGSQNGIVRHFHAMHHTSRSRDEILRMQVVPIWRVSGLGFPFLP